MLSILFASHNGATTLPLMLEAFCNLQIPDGGWKIIAVDNASTDNTSEILRKYSSKLPLEVIFCGERGKNRALNTGITNIEGDLVILTDDDIVPNADWLIEFEKSARLHSEFDIFGGAIKPYWQSPPPSWILNSHHVNMVVLYGLTPTYFKEGDIEPWAIWGANMMVRSKIFSSGYRFNEMVGPASGAYIMGSEKEFITRLSSAGHRCYFTPFPVVQHIIRPQQMERQWMIKRAFRSGRQHRYDINSNEYTSVIQRFIGIEPWQVRTLVESLFAAAFLRILFLKDKSFIYEWNIYNITGQIYQHYKS